MSTPVAPLALAFAAARLRIEAPRAPRRRGARCSAVTGARGAARRPIRCIVRWRSVEVPVERTRHHRITPRLRRSEV